MAQARTDAQIYQTWDPDRDGPRRPEPAYPIAFNPWTQEAIVRLVFGDGSTIDLQRGDRGFQSWLTRATQ